MKETKDITVLKVEELPPRTRGLSESEMKKLYSGKGGSGGLSGMNAWYKNATGSNRNADTSRGYDHTIDFYYVKPYRTAEGWANSYKRGASRVASWF